VGVIPAFYVLLLFRYYKIY